MADGTVRSHDGDVAAGFGEVLRGLKCQGCNLLVTGVAPGPTECLAARRLLGAAEEPRRRILAFPDAAPDRVGDYLPAGVDADGPDVWVVEQGAATRTVPAAATGVDLPSPGDEGALSDLRRELVGAIGFFDQQAEGLGPAELRLGLHALDVPLAADDRRTVERFLRAVTAMVRGVKGMGHYRLPLADDSRTVAELSPLFDARIELRKRDGLPAEHRWYVPGRGIETPWVRL